MPVTRVPPMNTSPLAGRSNPYNARNAVDLPAPLGPITPVIAPLRTASDTPCRMRMSP